MCKTPKYENKYTHMHMQTEQTQDLKFKTVRDLREGKAKKVCLKMFFF